MYVNSFIGFLAKKKRWGTGGGGGGKRKGKVEHFTFYSRAFN
jgi:hypothetical protein